MVATLTSLDWLQMLADATRVRLLKLLDVEEMSVGELCSVMQLPQSTVSRHLKLLSDDGWVANRRDGNVHLYRVDQTQWVESKRSLWSWVSGQAAVSEAAKFDLERMRQVLAMRRSRSEEFFSSTAEQWDRLRVELFGEKLDAFAFAATLPCNSVVGELGCGSAPLAQLVSPFVREVIAVDSSSAMLTAAQKRLANASNVRLLRAELDKLPIPSDTLDVAWLVLVLPYLAEPENVLREAARVAKPHSPLVIVDLMPHDRQAFRVEMGHLRLGIERGELNTACQEVGLVLTKFVVLPPDPQAKGPALFAAIASKRQ